MIPYRYLPDAERELDAVLAYYEQQAPGLSIDFLDELERTIEQARTMPASGTPALDVVHPEAQV